MGFFRQQSLSKLSKKLETVVCHGGNSNTVFRTTLWQNETSALYTHIYAVFRGEFIANIMVHTYLSCTSNNCNALQNLHIHV